MDGFIAKTRGTGYKARRERGVAQPGRALRSGRRGRRFESSLPDQVTQGLSGHPLSPCLFSYVQWRYCLKRFR